MGTKEFAFGVFASLALLVRAAAAQETVELPQIVVSPTTVPTPIDQIASSVTVITADDLKREQVRTVPDALRTVPGLNVVQTGGPGGQTAVFMRGTNSNHVKVLVDGIDVSDPSTPNGAYDYAHLLTGDVERIEILRGPQSGLYGSDAIGGVIAITTKKGEGPPKVSATLEGGSFGTFNQAASLSGAQGRFNYAFNVLHFRSTDTPVTPLSLLAPGEKRNNDRYDNETYTAKLGYDIADNVTLNQIVRYTDARLFFTGDNFVAFPPMPEALQDRQVNHHLFTRSEAVWTAFDGRLKNVVGIDYTNHWNWNYDPNPDSFTPFGAVAAPTTNIGEKLGYNWRTEAKVMPGETVVLGLEHTKDSLWTNSTLTPAGAPMVTTAANRNRAGFAEMQSNIAERFFLVSNVRYDDNESFGPASTWRLAPAFIVPWTDTKLKGSYGTGFKAPTLTELYVNNPAIGQVANPNLMPEKSRGYDYGFEQPLFNERLRFGLTYFRNRITDLINPQFNPATFTFFYTNVGQAETHGFESFASAVVTDRLKIRADYTYTSTRDLATDLGLLRRPGHKESVTAIWTPLDKLTLTTTVLHVSSWVDVSRDTPVFVPRLDAKPYTTVNLAANYQVDAHVSMFGRVDNLFNYQYQNPYGFDRPGIGIYGGVRVTN